MEFYPQARATEFSLAIEYLDLAPNMTLYDIPSGGGYLKQFVPVDDVHYVFVESSDNFASHCPKDPGCSTLLSSLTAIPLAPHSADRILSLAAIHHVENKQQFFEQCLGLLKPAGLLVVGDIDAGSNMARFLNEFVHQYNSMGHEGEFLTEGMEQSLESIGFEVVSNEYKPFTWKFNSVPEALSFFRDLFGLDLASDVDILDGIEKYLGFEKGVSTVSINWALRYLCLRPAKQVKNG
jgi:cyclopropane fatty-acyl-phospholipid synthase-like methyltransferase